MLESDWAAMARDGQWCFREGSSGLLALTDPWSRPHGKTRPSGQRSESQSDCRGLWGQEAIDVIIPPMKQHDLVLFRALTLPPPYTLQKFLYFCVCLTPSIPSPPPTPTQASGKPGPVCLHLSEAGPSLPVANANNETAVISIRTRAGSSQKIFILFRYE